jgi:hypothetical protein
MAGANTLRPIAVPSVPAESFARRRKFGMVGTAAWLCLAGVGSSQPLLQAAVPAPVPGHACAIQQRAPLYVGLAPGARLDSFEKSAVASRDIVREIKHWGCDASTSMSVAVPSLQLAFARSGGVRIERLQFDDSELLHAHVMLSSLDTTARNPQWRADLTRDAELGWRVTGTGTASADDLAAP